MNDATRGREFMGVTVHSRRYALALMFGHHMHAKDLTSPVVP
jgi:hypothetical protein